MIRSINFDSSSSFKDAYPNLNIDAEGSIERKEADSDIAYRDPLDRSVDTKSHSNTDSSSGSCCVLMSDSTLTTGRNCVTSDESQDEAIEQQQ
jgi:hypothetical protein